MKTYRSSVMDDIICIELSLQYVQCVADVNNIIIKLVHSAKDYLRSKNNVLHGRYTTFHESFSDYSVYDKNRILRAIECKYTDWDTMTARKYDEMRQSFRLGHGAKSNIYAHNDGHMDFFLKYPEVMSNGNIRCTIIMSVVGKRMTNYYYNMGKFNVAI